MKWLAPVRGRAWFRRFSSEPRAVASVRPVVPDMALLEPSGNTGVAHHFPATARQ